jgi:hypothetical protein
LTLLHGKYFTYNYLANVLIELPLHETYSHHKFELTIQNQSNTHVLFHQSRCFPYEYHCEEHYTCELFVNVMIALFFSHLFILSNGVPIIVIPITKLIPFAKLP